MPTGITSLKVISFSGRRYVEAGSLYETLATLADVSAVAAPDVAVANLRNIANVFGQMAGDPRATPAAPLPDVTPFPCPTCGATVVDIQHHDPAVGLVRTTGAHDPDGPYAVLDNPAGTMLVTYERGAFDGTPARRVAPHIHPE